MPRPKGHKRLLLEDYGLIVDGHIIDPSPNDTGTCTEHKLTSYWVAKIYKLVKSRRTRDGGKTTSYGIGSLQPCLQV